LLDAPCTDPGVRIFRTGLFSNTRFRTKAHTNLCFAFFAIPCSEVRIGIRFFMLGQCFLCRLRVVVSPFPLFPYTGTCERLSRSLSIMNSSDSLWSSAHYLFFASAYLAALGFQALAYLRFRVSPSVARYPYAFRRLRNSQGLPSSLTSLSTHTALCTPADPSRPHHFFFRSLCVGFWFRHTIVVCFDNLTKLLRASANAVSPAVYVILCLRFSYVIASIPARLDMN